MSPLDLVNPALQRQLRGLSVALRGGATDRARDHARSAIALVNEATDLSLTADDLLLALADGARTNRSGAAVIEHLLEVGVHRRLEARGAIVVEGGQTRFTRADDELRREVRALLGASESAIDSDPRWSQLLGG
jgi:hypothetical protein